VWPALRPIMSATALGALLAVALNAVLRIGVRQRAALEIDPARFDPQAVQDFAEARGAAWGARPDIIRRAAYAMAQLVEAVAEHASPRGPIRLEAAFDEFSLDVRVIYEGELLPLPDSRPSDEEIRTRDDGVQRLAGFMLRRNADQVSSTRRGEACTVHCHFDH
jgi:xanthine permease XanP